MFSYQENVLTENVAGYHSPELLRARGRAPQELRQLIHRDEGKEENHLSEKKAFMQANKRSTPDAFARAVAELRAAQRHLRGPSLPLRICGRLDYSGELQS